PTTAMTDPITMATRAAGRLPPRSSGSRRRTTIPKVARAAPEKPALTRTEFPNRAAISPRPIARRTPDTLTTPCTTPMRRRNMAEGTAQNVAMALRLMTCPGRRAASFSPRDRWNPAGIRDLSGSKVLGVDGETEEGDAHLVRGGF